MHHPATGQRSGFSTPSIKYKSLTTISPKALSVTKTFVSTNFGESPMRRLVYHDHTISPTVLTMTNEEPGYKVKKKHSSIDFLTTVECSQKNTKKKVQTAKMLIIRRIIRPGSNHFLVETDKSSGIKATKSPSYISDLCESSIVSFHNLLHYLTLYRVEAPTKRQPDLSSFCMPSQHFHISTSKTTNAPFWGAKKPWCCKLHVW